MECGREEIVEILAEFVKSDPEILREFPISLPNIVMPTMGGNLFWDDVAEIKGWRMQKNIFTEHWRLLDPKNMRYAWGVRGKMFDIFVKAARSMEEEVETSIDQEENDKEEIDDSSDTQSSDEESGSEHMSVGT
jgi:Sec-independent protein translocase protein TatA